MSTPFRQVVTLWITPDFTNVERGLELPPYVNHNTVDFEALGTFIQEQFYCGESVRIRMPNDTIDQVTLHVRMQTGNTARARCDDFAHALFNAARGKKPVIDIRQAWEPLHQLKDRGHAPPPSLLQFIVEGGFEAVMLWFHQASLRLHIRAADILLQTEGLEPSDHEGRLFPALQDELHRHFGIKFKAPCLLGKAPAHSPLPDWASGAR